MGNHEEKDQEKVSTPKVLESPAVKQDKSEPKVESMSEPKSDVSDKSEDVIKSLQGQISKLQKELNEKSDIKTQLKSLISDEEAESDVDIVEVLTNRLTSLESSLAQKDAEITKNAYIDSLDVDETIRRDLKRRIQPSEDLEASVEKELEAINELLQSSPQAKDTRPKGIGVVIKNSTDADYVLEHPELYK